MDTIRDRLRDNRAQSFTYEIAGHIIEIVWKLPDAQNWHLPGFAHFLSKKLSDAVTDPQIPNSSEYKLLTISILSIDEAEKDRKDEHPERTISTFDIENGTCELHKKDNSYKFQIFTVDGKLSVKLKMEKDDSSMDCFCELYENPTSQKKVPDPHHLRFALWMAGGFAGIPKWTAAIHASVIIYDNQAVLFLGESGTGKSTHTRLWLENIPGTRLLNDDSPILRLDKRNENPEDMSGGYPNGTSDGSSKGTSDGSSKGTSDGSSNGSHENTLYIYGSPWSGKGDVYLNENYPVAAIVRLQQAPYNRSTRLNVVQGFAALYPSFPPAYLNDEDLHQEICTIISEILKTVPVFRLECLPKPSAAMHMYQKIFPEDENSQNS